MRVPWKRQAILRRHSVNHHQCKQKWKVEHGRLQQMARPLLGTSGAEWKLKRRQAHTEIEQRQSHDQGAHQINPDRKSTRLNSSHVRISYAVFCLKKKKKLMFATDCAYLREGQQAGQLQRNLPSAYRCRALLKLHCVIRPSWCVRWLIRHTRLSAY